MRFDLVQPYESEDETSDRQTTQWYGGGVTVCHQDQSFHETIQDI
jgi:hypothetical protein